MVDRHAQVSRDQRGIDATSGAQGSQATVGPLRLLCIGSGRDGTTSITRMVQAVFDRETTGKRAEHEFQNLELSEAFCNYQETGAPEHLVALTSMVAGCPYECIVGNNAYAAILPLFIQHYGRGLKLVHIRRTDRAACIQSLKKNCQLFPRSYKYYISAAERQVKRITAVHYDEMTRDEWKQLSLDEKLAWYYDKTHTLIDSCKDLVDFYVEIATEDISSEAVRRVLGQVAVGTCDIVPPPTHMNRQYFDSSMLPRDRYQKAQWLLQWLDLVRMASDDTHLLEYAVERFVKWTGYQLRGELMEASPADSRSPEEIAVTLDRACRVFQSGLDHIDAYRLILERNYR